MAEGRMLKKRISLSKQVNDLANDTNRLTFTWLIAHLDIKGRFYGDAGIVKSVIYARRDDLSVKRVEEALCDIEKVGLGYRYIDKNTGDKVLQILGFERNQKLYPDREATSVFAEPDDNSRVTHELLMNTLPESKLKESKLKEIKLFSVDFEKSTLNMWNSFVDKHPTLSKVKEISGTRRKHLKQRYEQDSFRDFKAILDAIEEQPFLLNGNPSSEKHKAWKVSYDWLICNDSNYLRVLERKYKDTKSGGLEAYMKGSK